MYRGLYPIDAGHTRLVSRDRELYNWRMPWFVIIDPGGFVMSRQTLLGIKARVERIHGRTQMERCRWLRLRGTITARARVSVAAFASPWTTAW